MNDRMTWAAGGLAAVLAMALPAQASPDAVVGDWMTAGGGAKVRVAPCLAKPSLMCGTLVWLKQPNDKSGAPQRDLANPDAALRGRPLLGIPMISDFRRDGTGLWADGKIYDPNSGKTYRSKMALDQSGALKVSGCVLFVCQAQTWTRAPGS